MPLESKYLTLISQAFSELDHPKTMESFSCLYDRIVLTNEKINITSILSPMEFTLKHILDSLALLYHPIFQNDLKVKNICDIGCGGGFPGLPLAIARPHGKITMIDSTEKKIKALQENKDVLGLSGVFPLWGRGEDLASAKGGAHREKYDICVSRAVARLSVLSELCLPFVKPGGFLVALKGAKTEEELLEAKKGITLLGAKVSQVFPVSFPKNLGENLDFTQQEQEQLKEFLEASRFLVVIEKIRKTPPQYPRKWAQMMKKSL